MPRKCVFLLIYAGAIPRTDWLAGVVERDEQGYLISGQHLMSEGRRPAGWTAKRDPFYLETSVPGDALWRAMSGIGRPRASPPAWARVPWR